MSSTLNPDNFPDESAASLKGHDTKTLGPSDSSDSGSDLVGSGPVEETMPLDRGTNEDAGLNDHTPALDDNSDRFGTGARAAAGDMADVPDLPDIDTDRIVDASEAGLGTGLDQAEEARLAGAENSGDSGAGNVPREGSAFTRPDGSTARPPRRSKTRTGSHTKAVLRRRSKQ